MNNWEHRGEDMYCPRALLKLPRTGRVFFFFFFCVKDSPAGHSSELCHQSLLTFQPFVPLFISCSISLKDARLVLRAVAGQTRNVPFSLSACNNSHGTLQRVVGIISKITVFEKIFSSVPNPCRHPRSVHAWLSNGAGVGVPPAQGRLTAVTNPMVQECISCCPLITW